MPVTAEKEKATGSRVQKPEKNRSVAEEIFALFETTIAEYEEELGRFKLENKKKQELLDSVLNPKIMLHKENLHKEPRNVPQSRSMSPAPARKNEIPEMIQIKEEPELYSIKQEEEEVPVPVPDFSLVSVKTEESSSLQQGETEEQNTYKQSYAQAMTEVEIERSSDSGDTDHSSDMEADPQYSSDSDGDTDHSSDTDYNEAKDPLFNYSAEKMKVRIKSKGTAGPVKSSLSTKPKSAPQTSSNAAKDKYGV
ncbi:hypothetical protein WMY93_022684 [Mugilogobius chulae]|uniref:Uncharacterized protein n=1 Tax=Mugilogobius chulae TaxID=88201 RepID=A0AAW0NHR5_9GOBI